MNSQKKSIDYYMNLNYPYIVEEYDEDGEHRFGIKSIDLNGVWGSGPSLEEAYNDFQDSKRLWFETCLGKKIPIPEPMSANDFSGKFIIRIPPSLHMQVTKNAKLKGMSLNQYIKALLESDSSNHFIKEELIRLGSSLERRLDRLEKRM